MAALRERWPEAHIEVLGYPRTLELVNGRYYANGVRSIDAKPMAGFFVPNNILEPALMDYFGSFDVVISYLFDPDSIFANNVRRCGVKQVIEASPKPRELPAARHYCKPLEALAIYVEKPVPRIFLSDVDSAGATKFAGKGYVAVHPGSGSEKKNWPVEKFAALIKGLDRPVLIIEGEADAKPVAELKVPAQVVKGLSLIELAAVLEKCAVFVGNDSGITHLAAAVGIPVVAMFGPASTPVWEPTGERVSIVRFGEGDVALARAAMERALAGR